MNGTVRALFVKQEKGAKSVAKDSVQAGLQGFEGDHHAGNSKRRQILLMSGTVVDQLHLPPGSVYENVIVDGLDVMTLREGQRLRLGDALVVVTIPCEPCIQMERLRTGLQEALRNRRGMFVTVLEPGIVRVGDAVCGESAVEHSLER